MGIHLYTMALMPGGGIKDRIQQHLDGMQPGDACGIAAAIANAFAYAHAGAASSCAM